MQPHEIKYQARLKRGKPETAAEKKLYAALVEKFNGYNIRHMRVLENLTVTTFATSSYSMVIEIKDTNWQPALYPARFAIIQIDEALVLSMEVNELKKWVTGKMNEIQAKRIHDIGIKYMKNERQQLQEDDDE